MHLFTTIDHYNIMTCDELVKSTHENECFLLVQKIPCRVIAYFASEPSYG